MDFPAQLQMLPQEQASRIPSRNEQLTMTIRSKYDLLHSKPVPRFNLLKSYASVNPKAYNDLVAEFKELLNSMQEGQTPDLTKFLPLIFGALEGSSSMQDEMRVLIKRFGANIQKIQIDQITKGKIKNANYGLDKKKQTNIRQISDKTTLDSLGEYFDIKQIKSHRKMCSGIKSYLKSLKKFKQCLENSQQNEIFTEESMQNVAYIEFANEEISFNKMKIPNEVLGNQNSSIVQEKDENPSQHITPAKSEAVEALPKDETASGKKQEDSENKSSNMIQENKINEFKESDQQIKQTKRRRTKQQIQRDLQAKQKEREQKALQLKKKEEQRLLKLQEKEKERLAKQKQKEMERQMKQKEREAKQRERQAKQRQKEAERLAKEAERLAKEAERKAKEAAKQAERIAKEKKNNPGQSLAKWFKPAEQSTPMKAQREEKIEVQLTDSLDDQKKEFMRSINSKTLSMNELRNCFKSQKMKDETCMFEPYYATIYIHKSRLEFDRFLINEQRFKEYVQPHDEYQNGKYDDSSVEYEDFCGDFCDEKMDEMSVEDEEASFNSAIVPDTYISEDELSSLNESKDQINVKVNQGAEWSFSGSMNYTADRYIMFCCFEEDALPLPMNEPEQSHNEMTLNLKCELYKQIHGYYGAKDNLIKKLASIADKVPKSYLDTLIKETTTKRGNQRLVKPEIIEFLSEQRQNFPSELEEIKKKRDDDNMIEMRGKMNEKQRQIERLILEQAGTYYIIDLLHFLREKGFRMVKRDLSEFINARTGSEWDDVRRRMSKMQFKEKEKINNFLSKKEKEARDKKQETKEEKEQKGESEKKSSDSNEDNNDQNNKERQMQPEN